MKRPDLTWALNEISKDGQKAFYTGSISKKNPTEIQAIWKNITKSQFCPC